jgi:hypothetical protein
MDNKVFVLSEGKFGERVRKIISSGYDMVEVNISGYIKLCYQSEVVKCENYTNSELWNLIDNESIPKGLIIKDKVGNELIFTGKCFQLYIEDIEKTHEYIGFCKGDLWSLDRIVDFDEEMKKVNITISN